MATAPRLPGKGFETKSAPSPVKQAKKIGSAGSKGNGNKK